MSVARVVWYVATGGAAIRQVRSAANVQLGIRSRLTVATVEMSMSVLNYQRLVEGMDRLLVPTLMEGECLYESNPKAIL